jgi:hypothetical protein
VNIAKVVGHSEQGKGVLVVLGFLGMGVCQARETAVIPVSN